MTTTQETSPAISVLMPVFNGEKHLHEAIDSILAQTFTDFEFIIVDDGSTDATAAILAEYAQRDSRIRILTNETNCKIAVSLNKGLAAAKAPLIARMDADDISLQERLEIQYCFMQKNQNIEVCGAELELQGESTIWHAPRTHEAIKAALLFHSCIFHPTSMYKKNTILECGGYQTEDVPAEDYALWVRLLKKNTIFANIPEVLLHYRTVQSAEQGAYKIKQSAIATKVRQQALNQLNLFPTEEEKKIHEGISTYSIPCTPEAIKHCDAWLNKLYVKGQQISPAFAQALNEELSYRWCAWFWQQKKLTLRQSCLYFASRFSKYGAFSFARIAKRLLQ